LGLILVVALAFYLLQLTWLNHHLTKIWPYVDEVCFYCLIRSSRDMLFVLWIKILFLKGVFFFVLFWFDLEF